MGAKNKNGEQNIAPLQPLTLASFQTWGSSAGAGRVCSPDGKSKKLCQAYQTTY